jgi:hypothetical protein
MHRSSAKFIRHESAPEYILFALPPVLAQPDSFIVGRRLTADDVKWTFDRLINMKDQPSQYVTNVSAVNVVDPQTVDIMLVDPTQPILAILSGPNFGSMEARR